MSYLICYNICISCIAMSGDQGLTWLLTLFSHGNKNNSHPNCSTWVCPMVMCSGHLFSNIHAMQFHFVQAECHFSLSRVPALTFLLKGTKTKTVLYYLFKENISTSLFRSSKLNQFSCLCFQHYFFNKHLQLLLPKNIFYCILV